MPKTLPLCVMIIPILLLAGAASAQKETDWMAPEGKIINYRTLDWGDFLGRPHNKFEKAYVAAATQPAIYAIADSGMENASGRVTFKFKIKCAFQSASWVNESLEKDHSDYVLNHEQDHYDIALTYANMLQASLESRDFSREKYEQEIDDIMRGILIKYEKTQDDYDDESNHCLIHDKQELWDLRIKKCYENNTDEFYKNALNDARTVTYLGQKVKRLPKENTRQFLTRCRPLGSLLTEDLATKTIETKEWTTSKSILAMYLQKYKVEVPDMPAKESTRTLVYMFSPTEKEAVYKRVVVDSFYNDDHPVNISEIFFANADSDNVKELVIVASSKQNEKQATGTEYIVRVYDNMQPRIIPGRLKRLDDISSKLEGGFEGTLNGKPVKAKCKNQKEVADLLKKMGYTTL